MTLEIGVLGHREGTAAGAANRSDDVAYGALIGEAAIRGLNLVPPADCVGLAIEEGRVGPASRRSRRLRR
ncbi:hypothetical protein GZ998_06805 [Actinomyces sp. 594]|uniref:hypothetical protein n=1 Tax=Actinomyces sp. 594 TaxID=2057793 RepID=UPI001C55F1F5|nr:hypothetical protein [Actinomyces sp. 594]MBW3069211.1 hypothetical protein [Actinomyces sp. 594]